MLASPCINVCRMDPASGLCLGCLRTIDEIAGWSRSDDAARALVLAAVARRRARANGADERQPQGGSPMNDDEDLYPCVGICTPDPDSGYCLGCGRPPLSVPGIVAEICQPVVAPSVAKDDPDSTA